MCAALREHGRDDSFRWRTTDGPFRWLVGITDVCVSSKEAPFELRRLPDFGSSGFIVVIGYSGYDGYSGGGFRMVALSGGLHLMCEA